MATLRSANIYFLVSTLVLLLGTIDCNPTSADGVRLYNQIISVHNKDALPLNFSNETLNVKISFQMTSLSDFDEVSGELVVIGIVTLKWTNSILTWDSATYGGLTEFIIRQDDIWNPPLTLANSLSSMKELGDKNTKIVINNVGDNVWKIPVILKGACSVDVQYFPFDNQNCSMDFSVWDYFESEIKLDAQSTEIEMSQFEENIQWVITESKANAGKTQDGSSQISYQILLSRRPMYFIIVMIAPIVLLGIMNVFAFYINIEEGRVGFAMNVVLTYSIFLTLVGDNLPRSSDPMSLLSYYLVCEVGVSGIVTVLSIFSVRMHVKDDDLEVPQCVLTFVSLICCNICKNPNSNQIAPEDDKRKEKKDDAFSFMQNNTFEMRMIETLPSSVKFGAPNQKWKINEIEEDTDNMKDFSEACYVPKLHWIQVAKSLDHFFFLVTFIGQIALAVIFLLPIYLNQN